MTAVTRASDKSAWRPAFRMAGVAALALFLAAGCGNSGPDITPQTMQRARELLDRYERTRQEFYQSDLPGQTGQPDPAWIEEALSLLDSPAGRKADAKERQTLQVRAWMLKGDWDLAAEALEGWVQGNGAAEAEQWRKLALCLLKMGPAGWERAEVSARKSLDLDPKSAEGWWLAGKAAQALEKTDEAQQCFAKSREADPAYLPARLEQAIEAVRAGDLAAAAAIIRDAGKKIRPYDVMLRLEFRRAIADAEKAGKLPPSSPDQFASAARAYYQAARFEDAVQWAGRAMEQNPDDFETLGLQALVLTQIGRTEDAVGVCQRFVESHPEHEGAAALLRQIRQAADAAKTSKGGAASPIPPGPSVP